MARLASETFDFWPINTATAGTVTRESDDPRHGAGAAEIPSNGVFNIVEPTIAPVVDRTFFYRFNCKLSALTAKASALAVWRALDATGTVLEMSVDKTGKVDMWNGVAAAHPAGKTGLVVPEEWFLIEVMLRVNAAGKGIVAWRMNEEQMAAAQEMNVRNLGIKQVRHGNPSAENAGLSVFIDDIAINDETGDSANTWVGGFADQLPARSLLYWGGDMAETAASGPSEPAPYQDDGLERWNEFEGQAERAVGIVHLSDPWHSETGPEWDGWFTGASDRVHDRGAIVMKSIGGPENVIQRVNEGEFDDAWRVWAEEARDWGHPFFLRLWWEFNGTWFNFSRAHCTGAEFIAAWRRIHGIIQKAGAKNVTFVWCPNAIFEGHTNPFGDVTIGTESFYPGDDYVDWTGVDGYTGQNPNKLLGWRTAKAVLGPTYDLLVEECPDKPIMICETAASEYFTKGNPPEPPHKAEWIEALLEYTLPYEWPQIRAFVWFNWYITEGGGKIDWEIGSSPSSIAAFAKGIGDPHFVDPPVESFRELQKVPLPGELEVVSEIPLPDRPALTVPKLAVPIRTDSTGTLAVVEQDSVEDVAASVYALISTERGSRLSDPDYGVEDASFEVFPPDDAIDEWLVQIERYEPRAQVRTAAELRDLVALVNVRVGVRE